MKVCHGKIVAIAVFLTVGSLALVVTDAVDANVPRLRSGMVDSDSESVQSFSQDRDNPGNMSGRVSEEKSVKCDGGFHVGKGSIKKCHGDVKTSFSGGFSADEMASVLAEQVLEVSTDFMPNSAQAFHPDDQTMFTLEEITVSQQDEPEQRSKTVSYGGMMKLDWKCDITYGYEDGEFTKKASCRFEGASESGKKSKSVDDPSETFSVDGMEF